MILLAWPQKPGSDESFDLQMSGCGAVDEMRCGVFSSYPPAAVSTDN